MMKNFDCITAALLYIFVTPGLVNAQVITVPMPQAEEEFAVLEYPDTEKPYMDEALSFDSIFEAADHTPEFHYFNDGDEKLSAVHELINSAEDGSVIEIPEGEYISEYFEMKDRHNLTLKAKPGTVWLVSDDNLSTIMYMVECTNITLQGIGFLHRTGGFCAGNSIEISGCKNIVLDSCDISGSGTIGVCADCVDGLVVKNSYIHHCTYQMMSLYNVRDVILFNNLFTYNTENITITEGVTIGSIWGKCIIQNNTFYKNTCCALVFDIQKQEEKRKPVGNGFVYIRRNLFYDNYSYAKLASIFDVFCDEMWGDYTVRAKDVVEFRENVFNTYSNAPIDEGVEDLSGEYYYLYPETFVGDFDLEHNFFQDIHNRGYRGYTMDMGSFLCGIDSSAVRWLNLSRNPQRD
jgi:hypothetical protein